MEILEVYNSLGPSLDRTFEYVEGGPRVTSVPIGSPGDKPFYGVITDFLPLYERTDKDKDCNA